ncbi:MAG: hypothetical protein AAGE01_22125 [Pseudomonadota bacterium]
MRRNCFVLLGVFLATDLLAQEWSEAERICIATAERIITEHPGFDLALVQRMATSSEPADRLALAFLESAVGLDGETESVPGANYAALAGVLEGAPDDPIVLAYATSLCGPERAFEWCPEDLAPRWLAADPMNRDAWQVAAASAFTRGDVTEGFEALGRASSLPTTTGFGTAMAIVLNAVSAHGAPTEDDLVVATHAGFAADLARMPYWRPIVEACRNASPEQASVCVDYFEATGTDERASIMDALMARGVLDDLDRRGVPVPAETLARVRASAEQSEIARGDMESLNCGILRDPIATVHAMRDYGEIGMLLASRRAAADRSGEAFESPIDPLLEISADDSRQSGAVARDAGDDASETPADRVAESETNGALPDVPILLPIILAIAALWLWRNRRG